MDSESLMEGVDDLYASEGLFCSENFKGEPVLCCSSINIFSPEVSLNNNSQDISKTSFCNDSNHTRDIEYDTPTLDDLQTNNDSNIETNCRAASVLIENLDSSSAFRALTNKIIESRRPDEIILQRDQNTIIFKENNCRYVYKILTEDNLYDENDAFEFDDDANNEMAAVDSLCSKQLQQFDLATSKGSKNTGPRPGKRGRPRKNGNKVSVTKEDLKTSNTKGIFVGFSAEHRTRSGRIVKPQYSSMEQKNFGSSETAVEMVDKFFQSNGNFEKNQIDSGMIHYDREAVEEENKSIVKRKFPSDSICPTCNKVFLGKRMQKHYLKFPDHVKQDNSLQTNEEKSLFRFLIDKLNKNPSLTEDQRADLFLNEIDDFVNQLQLRSSRLIHNTSGLHFISGRSSRVLGIPEGQYALDLSALDQLPEPEPENTFSNMNFNPMENVSIQIPSGNTRSLDITALSMDETLTDEAVQKLNLSVGGKLLPPSEESLLRAVDDLGIKKIDSVLKSSSSHSALIPHYDQVNDNAVEAAPMKETKILSASPILDLSVDFFKFNNL